ncbi:hypothetical protein [Stutzerimonas kunmingensis]|uniref:hypothetical protein n=1 Tax=Stutzerimonas kunmingensis TaxID=1211807 RepID=UPI002FCC4ABD
MANILDLAGYVHGMGEQGRQRGERTYLGKLMGQAYQTDDPAAQRSLLGQVFQAAPEQGAQFASHMGQDRQQRMSQLAQKVAYFVGQAESGNQAVVQSLYPQIAQEARTMGLGDVPLAYDPSFLPGLKSMATAFQGQQGTPAATQVFEAQARAAGLTPGSPEYQRAAQIALGLEGRASSAGYGFTVEEDAYGNPRERRRNPRTGNVEVFHDETGRWVPLGAAGGGAPAGGPGPVQERTGSAPMPAGGDIFAGLKQAIPGLRITDQFRTPEENAALPNAASNSYHLKGQAVDIGTPTPEQQQQIADWLRTPEGSNFELIRNYADGHWHIEPRPGRAPAVAGGPTPAPGMGGGGSAPDAPVAPPAQPADPYANSPYLRTNVANVGGGTADMGLGRGRRSEDKIAAEERARREVGLSFADREADAAARAAGGKKEAELAAERAANAPKTIARYEAALTTAANVTQSIDNALGLISPMSAGFGGARLRGIEGTPAFNLAAEVQTIKANLGFDRLQQMRDNSPTGGALGQVAVQELVALQSTVANLDPDQSEEQLRANLGRVKEHYARWRKAVEDSIAEERALQQASPQQPAGNGWAAVRVK